MPKKPHKSLKTYLSRLKKITTLPSTSSFLAACKYPKTPSFDHRHVTAGDGAPPSTSATLSDVDRFLCENFHSLYLDHDDAATTTITDADAIKPSYGRFFVSPERASSSLITTSSSSSSASVPGDSIAVMTLSRDPYEDFRRSMKEMMDSRHVDADEMAPLDWDFMEELLFCYLELNERAVRKHILKAFTDLMASFQGRGIPAADRRRERRRKVYRDLEEEDNY